MKITRDEVEAELKKIWPDLEYVWLWDKGYWKGTKDQVERLMDKSKLKDVQFVADFFDCDDFAAQFKEEVRRTRYFAWKDGFGDDPPVPYAIFFAAGDMFRGVGEMHAVNLVILRDPDPGVWIASSSGSSRWMRPASPATTTRHSRGSGRPPTRRSSGTSRGRSGRGSSAGASTRTPKLERGAHGSPPAS